MLKAFAGTHVIALKHPYCSHDTQHVIIIESDKQSLDLVTVLRVGVAYTMPALKPLLSALTKKLGKDGVSFPSSSVLRITEHVLNRCADSFPETVSNKDVQRISELSQRRLEHEPLQYIIGEWDFYNLRGIKCAPPTLIPRPETEQLVRLVDNHIVRLYKEHPRRKQQQQPQQLDKRREGDEDVVKKQFLEVGVGTGAISIALLRSILDSKVTREVLVPDLARIEWSAVGIDIAAAAVELCRENAECFEVSQRLHIAQCDIADLCTGDIAVRLASAPPSGALKAAGMATLPGKRADGMSSNNNGDSSSGQPSSSPSSPSSFEGFDFIVSNPPYIPSSRINENMQKEVFLWEDHDALDGGADGLDIVRNIFRVACSYTDVAGGPHASSRQQVPLLKHGGSIWLELDESNAAAVDDLVSSSLACFCVVFCTHAQPRKLFELCLYLQPPTTRTLARTTLTSELCLVFVLCNMPVLLPWLAGSKR